MRKILVISPRPTHRPTTGARKAIFDYCALLKEMGYDIYFFHIKDQVKERFWNNVDYEETKTYWGDHYFELYSSFFPQFIRWIWANFLKIISICFFRKYFWVDMFYDPCLAYKVNKLHKQYKFDSVICNYVWLSKSLSRIEIDNKMLFTHDVFSHKTISSGVRSQSLTPSSESKGLRRISRILAIQSNEAVFFKYLAPLSDIYTVYSPFDYIQQPVTLQNNILFMSGDNHFNVNGIFYFIEEVFPEILNSVPETKLIIGGTICNQIKHIINHPNILLEGPVPSVKEFYLKGDIVINPVYQGSGLKIKTFEAISCGKLIFVHPHSTEGIYDKDNAPLVVCNNTDEFKLKIIYMLKNKNDNLLLLNKEKCKDYIASLNNYIKNQYRNCIEK
jgi:glycosyltransferase involved in cell wall biosynthesis